MTFRSNIWLLLLTSLLVGVILWAITQKEEKDPGYIPEISNEELQKIEQ